MAQMQLQLEQQFSGLVAARKPLGYPVYALEHGLDASVISGLRQAASEELQKVGLLEQHWLVWTALATNAGYRYEGEEYWPALAHIPGEWQNNNNRHWLRRCFQRFRDNFGGPVPVGRWAEHFNIISWPIANAIIPRYLQSLFARRLYDLRFELGAVAIDEGVRLGQVLLDRYDGASARFHDFLQQTELTTQIVLALRDEDIGEKAARISPCLLSTIVADLEARRESRDFLRAARKVISERRASISSQLRVPTPGTSPLSGDTQVITGPRLAARVGEKGAILGLIFPDIAAALQLANIPHSALETARMQMSGSNQLLEPALGLLTFSKRDRQLEFLPQAGQPIIALESANNDLVRVVTPLLMIAERRAWVLRRHVDGLYREVAGGHVRADNSYVILTRLPIVSELAARADLKPLAIRSSGVIAYTLEIGSNLMEAQRAALFDFGVGSVTGTRIEAVGLAPSLDQQFYAPTWFSTEAVMLRIVADFGAGGFAIRLNDFPLKTMNAENGQILLALGELACGPHQLSVQALAKPPDMLSATGETAVFDFLVVPPPPWQEAMRSRAGFRLMTTPSTTRLEDILVGRAKIEVVGPIGRTIHWSLETYDAFGHLATTGDGGATQVNADDDAIAAVMSRLRQTQSEAIDISHRVDIVASLGDLGRQAIKFTHQVEPLRWAYDPSHHVARLIDETAHEGPVIVRCYNLAKPLLKTNVMADAALAGITITPPGALLVVNYLSSRYAVFVSAPATGTLTALSELGLVQLLDIAKSDSEALLILLASLDRWRQARPLGRLAIVRQAKTTTLIEHELTIRACGRDFAIALARESAQPLERAQSMVGGSPGFGFRMRTFTTPSNLLEGRKQLSDIARNYNIEADSELCAAAYDLAFDPLSLRLGKGETARTRIALLLANRPLVRGAFLAHVAVSREVKIHVAAAI